VVSLCMLDKFVVFYLFVFILRKLTKFNILSVSCFHNGPKFIILA